MEKTRVYAHYGVEMLKFVGILLGYTLAAIPLLVIASVHILWTKAVEADAAPISAKVP